MSDFQSVLQAAIGPAYRIDRELGGGGMSRVFVAEEVAFGRRVVIKVLAPELSASVDADRFRREIQLAAQLQHPGIVPLLTAGSTGELLWYVMPLVEGESLRTRLANGALPVEDAVRLWRDLLEALEYAHSRGIVHRDIKPENIMLTGRRAVTLDFGVAKAVSASTQAERGATMTGVGLAIGTPAYMAPEQAAGDGAVDARADLYSAGLVLYEMLAGRGPFDAQTPAALMAAQIVATPAAITTHRSDVPVALAETMMACLAKQPSDRPSSASVILAGLDVPTIGVVTGAGSNAASPRRNTRRALIAVALVFVAVAAGYFVTRARKASDAATVASLAELPDSSRLSVAFLPVVADAADSILAQSLISAQIRSLQEDRRILLQSPERIRTLATDVGVSIASKDSLRQLYRDLGVHAYVVHTIARAGSGMLMVAEGFATKSDSMLFRVEKSISSPAEHAAKTAEVVQGAAVALLAAAGRIDRPLVTGRMFGTTPEAARLWIEAQEPFARRDYIAAARIVRTALEFDSTFALGWNTLASALGNGNLGEDERFRAMTNAFRYRGKIPSTAMQELVAAYYFRITGNGDSSIAIGKRIVRASPDDNRFETRLGLAYLDNRQYELAARVFRAPFERARASRMASIEPGNYLAALIELGQADEVRAVVRQTEAAFGPNSLVALGVRSGLAYMTLDPDSLEAAARVRIEVATSESDKLVGYTFLRNAMLLGGRLASASELNALRAKILREGAQSNPGVVNAAHEAMWKAMVLDAPVPARAFLDSALRAWGWDTLAALDRGYGAVVAARVAMGDVPEARRLVTQWRSSIPPEMAKPQEREIQNALGEIALASGDGKAALAHFRAADLGRCESCVWARYARAFDQMKQADSVIYWYERVLARPSSQVSLQLDEIPRAYRRLGELYEAKGDTKRAIQRYSDFVELWKNADPALQPLVKEVRERIARLQKKAG